MKFHKFFFLTSQYILQHLKENVTSLGSTQKLFLSLWMRQIHKHSSWLKNRIRSEHMVIS
jgi:hypothetical protein